MLYKVSTVSVCQFQSLNSPHPPQPSHPHPYPATWWGFLFNYFWLHCVFVTGLGLSLVAVPGLLIAEVSFVGEHSL